LLTESFVALAVTVFA